MPKLGQLLVQRGWATPEAVRAALRAQQAAGGRLGTALVGNNALSEDILFEALGAIHGVPAATVRDFDNIPEEALSLLPAKVARRCRAVPLRAYGTKVDIALVDPGDLACRDELSFALGRRLEVHAASELRISQALARHYDAPLDQRFEALIDRLDRSRYLWADDSDALETPPGGTNPEAELSLDRMPDLPSPKLSGAAVLRSEAARRRAAPAPPTPPPKSRPVPSPAAGSDTTADKAAPQRHGHGHGHRRTQPELPASVRLSADERRLLFSEPSGTRRSADEPPPVSFAAARERLGAADSPEEIADVLVAFLGQMFQRVALFKVLRDRVEGWRSAGDTLDPSCIERFRAELDSPSVFLNIQQGASFFLGPLPPMPVHQRLAHCWGDALPEESLLLPVRVRDRLVTVVYLDRGPGGLKSIDLEGLKDLTRTTAEAYERCILRNRKG